MQAPQPGGKRNCAGIDQRFPVAVRFRSRLHFGAGRREIKFNAVGDLSAASADYFGSVVQIFEARVNTRQQIRLLDRDAFSLHLRKRDHRLHFVRSGDMRHDAREIQFQLDRVFRVRISANIASVLPPIVDVGVAITGAARCVRVFQVDSDS